jgi:cob(I)alamin adenosyltransferase
MSGSSGKPSEKNRLDKIYTRGGDKGKTSLAMGQRYKKCDDEIQALGDVDELNCQIGIVLSLMNKDDPLTQALTAVQNTLFDIGAQIAMKGCDYPPLKQSLIDNLEKKLDEINAKIPSLTEFILPGGHPISAQCHLARAICRRAERQLVQLSLSDDTFGQPLKYLNRLSDYLFVAARYLNSLNQHPETLWQPSTNKAENDSN